MIQLTWFERLIDFLFPRFPTFRDLQRIQMEAEAEVDRMFLPKKQNEFPGPSTK